MGAVVHPLTCRDGRRVADDGDQVAKTACFSSQQAEAVLGIVNVTPFANIGDHLSAGLGRGLRHRP
jgi:hypothetical protein